ncbi:hypothetical protein BKA70DRAFT_1229428 [Coprinopsis sp. MPI-PUGE-AT-0042]|nr:hypothetical protein BKA70DRAFT_1229428 [Coprinopsis sp. MPI-PUGE-AT-0042]
MALRPPPQRTSHPRSSRCTGIIKYDPAAHPNSWSQSALRLQGSANDDALETKPTSLFQTIPASEITAKSKLKNWVAFAWEAVKRARDQAHMTSKYHEKFREYHQRVGPEVRMKTTRKILRICGESEGGCTPAARKSPPLRRAKVKGSISEPTIAQAWDSPIVSPPSSSSSVSSWRLNDLGVPTRLRGSGRRCLQDWEERRWGRLPDWLWVQEEAGLLLDGVGLSVRKLELLGERVKDASRGEVGGEVARFEAREVVVNTEARGETRLSGDLRLNPSGKLQTKAAEVASLGRYGPADLPRVLFLSCPWPSRPLLIPRCGGVDMVVGGKWRGRTMEARIKLKEVLGRALTRSLREIRRGKEGQEGVP